MAQTDDQKWIKVTNNGEWDTHTVSTCFYLCVCKLLQYHVMCGSLCAPWPQVSLKSGTNILYWRTTGILVGGKMVKPVLLKNIQIEGKSWPPAHGRMLFAGVRILKASPHFCPGVAYTSECFPCRPGWFSPTPGSSSCQPCPSNTYSVKGASSCTPCPEHHYSRTYRTPNSTTTNSVYIISVIM